jgi:4-hydroxy-3-methylbut-2-enyl diphosphate reductase
VIDTTCPFVKRAQIAARRLAEAGFYVVIYGEAQHPEVKGILGWAQENGIAILDVKDLIIPEKASRRIGILSQTTQIAENFIQFAKDIIDITLSKDVEIRIMDTICHDIRKRQIVSLELAEKVDLMLVVGGHFSANTKRLAELSSQVTETYLVGTAEEINTEWLKGKSKIGVTSGASTSEQTIDDVIKHLTDSKINME